MNKQVFNPYLPLDEYIPDGEPHVFGDRLYIFGSHDKARGDTFCMLDYRIWSCPIDDLSAWSNKGFNYSSKQDPLYCEERQYMYAPDCVKGNDGRYYLYYSLSGFKGVGGYYGPFSVAVSDTPDGQFKFLGHLKNKDGSIFNEKVCFDPALINDDGVIRMYYGTCYQFEREGKLKNLFVNDKKQMKMFNKTRKEVRNGVMGSYEIEIEDDMLTVKTSPKLITPTNGKGTEFDGHEFFEGSSIRKINGKYYFIYSSVLNHELCCAISDYPDRDFKFKGMIISNGDVGLNGRKQEDRLNMTATNHGSIECVNGQYYVFYHRVTHGGDYSRQACAEKIKIEDDGSIKQVEVTSCGLNNGPLKEKGTYPAGIYANLTNGHMPHTSNGMTYGNPMMTSNPENEETYLTNLKENTLIRYKYFAFKKDSKISINARGKGTIMISLNDVRCDEIKIDNNNFQNSKKISLFEVDEGCLEFYIIEGDVEIKDFLIS